MQILETHTSKTQELPIRFQEYGVAIFKTITTKSALKKAIKKKQIYIDGILATTSKFILGGAQIDLVKTKENRFQKKLALNLEVLFEDDYLAIICKPPGVLVSGNKFVTVVNTLPQNLKRSKQKDAIHPQPIHRLDYPTSGLLLVGKTISSIQILSKLFEHKKIKKTYYAVVIGKICSGGTINFAVDNKNASTLFTVMKTVESKRFIFLNLVKLSPKTGRKHQLRKHLSSIGHQILGDKDYGEKELFLKGKGLYLHAYKLEFLHPFTKEKIIISKKLPQKFSKIFP